MRKTQTHTFVLISGDEALHQADAGHYIFVTHDGIAHADDVAACAAWAIGGVPLEIREIRVLRTRNEELIARLSHRSNVVIADVGGRFDPVANVFDHHFKDNEKREDGLPYSSFGLLVRHMGGAAAADTQLVRHIDAIDNGVKGFDSPEWWPSFNKMDPMGGSMAWAVRHAAPVHNDGSPVLDWEFDARFCRLAHAFEKIFVTPDEVLKVCGIPFPVQKMFEGFHHETEVATKYSEKRVQELIKGLGEDGQVLCLPQYEVAALDVLAGLPEDHLVKYLVYPGPGGRQWMVHQVPNTIGSFAGRLPLPEAWAGLNGEALAVLTGVPDAVFCHAGRFIAGAVSREGALALAQKALEEETLRLLALLSAERQAAEEKAQAEKEALVAEAAQAELQKREQEEAAGKTLAVGKCAKTEVQKDVVEQCREDGPGVEPMAQAAQ